MKEHEENRGEDNVVHLALDVVTQIQIYMQKKKNQSCTFNTCAFYIIELYLNFFKKTKKKKSRKIIPRVLMAVISRWWECYVLICLVLLFICIF